MQKLLHTKPDSVLCCCSRVRYLTLHVLEVARGSWPLNLPFLLPGAVDLWAETRVPPLLLRAWGPRVPAWHRDKRLIGSFGSFWETAARPSCCCSLAKLSFYFGKEQCRPADFPGKLEKFCENKQARRGEVFFLRRSADLSYLLSLGQQCPVCWDFAEFPGGIAAQPSGMALMLALEAAAGWWDHISQMSHRSKLRCACAKAGQPWEGAPRAARRAAPSP